MKKLSRIARRHLVGMDIPVTGDIDAFLEKLRPGDIILTKDINLVPRKKFEKLFLGKGGWSHAGLYAGGDRMIHLYSPLKGKSKGDRAHSKVREHLVSSLIKGERGRDLLALRVKAMKNREGLKAIEKARSLKETFKDYNEGDAIRSILFPSKNQEVTKEDLEHFMCTFLPAVALQKWHLSKRSPSHTRPYDFIASDKTEGIAGFDRSSNTPILDGIRQGGNT